MKIYFDQLTPKRSQEGPKNKAAKGKARDSSSLYITSHSIRFIAEKRRKSCPFPYSAEKC